MPRDKDLKRVVRTRMKKTGESYTTARANLTHTSISRAAAKPAPAQPRPDWSALAGKRDEIMIEKTGRDWQEWVRLLDGHNAHELKHGDIARIVSGDYGIPNWWTQTVTVGYERIKGLRAVGQRRGGTFEATRSKTFAVPADALFAAIADGRRRGRWWPGVRVDARPDTAVPSIKVKSDDGSATMIWIVAKGATKSTLTLAVSNLPDRAAADRAKAEWTARFAALGQLLNK